MAHSDNCERTSRHSLRVQYATMAILLVHAVLTSPVISALIARAACP